MSSASEAHNAVIAELSPELDQLAIDAMADWKVPGAALAVVQDGKVALVKAYGQRDIDANLPVTPSRSGSYPMAPVIRASAPVPKPEGDEIQKCVIEGTAKTVSSPS